MVYTLEKEYLEIKQKHIKVLSLSKTSENYKESCFGRK